jgi:hypothetical protein
MSYRPASRTIPRTGDRVMGRRGMRREQQNEGGVHQVDGAAGVAERVNSIQTWESGAQLGFDLRDCRQ